MSDAKKVAHRLMAFHLLPIRIYADGAGKSLISLFRDCTGLSKAKIASGQLDNLRPSTHARIQEYQKSQLAQQFKHDPDGLTYAQRRIETAPRTSSGKQALLASWIHVQEDPPAMTLPMSKKVASELDQFVEALLSASEANDLLGFKDVIHQHLEQHGLTVRLDSAPIAMPVPPELHASWQALESWEQAEALVGEIAEHAYWDLISTLDAEWSSLYFAARQREPLFPLVMVRPQEGLLQGAAITSARNIIYRPSRRLLEFLYALVFYIKHKTWPPEPPSPKMLADALNESPSTVSNHFDGSSKLRVSLVNHYWQQLYTHVPPDTAPDRRAHPPSPMIALALHWQRVLLPVDGTKGKTFIVPDLDSYQVRWTIRRRQWDAAQTERHTDEAGPRGHSTDRPIEWPAWMKFTQSSSPV